MQNTSESGGCYKLLLWSLYVCTLHVVHQFEYGPNCILFPLAFIHLSWD